LELLHQVLRLISITGKRQIHFEIEAVVFVLIVLVIEFTALLCRHERLTLALCPCERQAVACRWCALARSSSCRTPRTARRSELSFAPTDRADDACIRRSIYQRLWICSRAGVVCSFSAHSGCAVFPRRRGRSPIGSGQGPGPDRIVCLHAANVAPRNFGKIPRQNVARSDKGRIEWSRMSIID